MQAENNNDIAITEAKLKDFLSSVLSSEGIVVDIRRTFIEYNGVNRSRVFARHANRMACKGSNEKFVVIALLCYPALQWLLKAQDIDALIEKLKEENEDESVWRMSNIQRILESSMGGCKPQLRLEMRKLFFARCQQLVDEIDEAMNKAVFMNPSSKPSRISLAMAMLRGSILDSDPVTAVTIRNNFDSIIEDVTTIAGDAIKPLVMQLAPNEGEAKTAEAAYLYHNTEVLLREYSRIVNPSVADENRSLRILAQGGNTLESDARCHQAQVLVQYAQLIRGAIELVKDFPGDSKLYDVLSLTDMVSMGRKYRRHSKEVEASALELVVTESGNTALKLDAKGSKDYVEVHLSRKEARKFKAAFTASKGESLSLSLHQYKIGGKKYYALFENHHDKYAPVDLEGVQEEKVKTICRTARSVAAALYFFSLLLYSVSFTVSVVLILAATGLIYINIPFLPDSAWDDACEFIKRPKEPSKNGNEETDVVPSAASIILQNIMDKYGTAEPKPEPVPAEPETPKTPEQKAESKPPKPTGVESNSDTPHQTKPGASNPAFKPKEVSLHSEPAKAPSEPDLPVLDDVSLDMDEAAGDSLALDAEIIDEDAEEVSLMFRLPQFPHT